MRLPKSFNDVTISQFQECYFILKADPTLEGWAKVISILSGKPLKEIEEIPVYKLKMIKLRLLFILDDESINKKVRQYIAINGRVFKAIYEANKLSTAQLIDIKTFLKPQEGMSFKDNVVENAHKLLASIYLPLTWNGFKYSGTDHEKISKQFLGAKMGDVYGTLFFYSLVLERLTEHMEASGKEPLQTLTDHLKEVELWASKRDLEITGVGK